MDVHGLLSEENVALKVAARFLLLFLVAGEGPLYGQQPAPELVQATSAAVSHVRAMLPEGPVAIDTEASQQGTLAAAVASGLGIGQSSRGAAIQCRARRDCSLVGVVGLLAVTGATLAGDSAQVVVLASREYELPTHHWIGSKWILVRLARDGQSWRVVDAVVKRES